MRKKLISGVLSAAMLLGVAFPATPGYAVEEPSAAKGMEISKTAVANGDGTYTITLEAYGTGAKVITETKKDAPTDIVLVLDQSGSMDKCIVCGESISYGSTHKKYTYTETKSVSNSRTYYVKSGSSYVAVSYCSGSHWSNWGGYYNCAGGAGWYTSTSSSDHTANKKYVPNTQDAINGVQFYTRTQAGNETCSSRLKALKDAVNTFAASVAEKAAGPDKNLATVDDNVKHRIAVVGFASGDYYSYNDEYYNYGNTEVFVGGNEYTYGTDAEGVYDEAFQSMDTTAGQDNVTASINALDGDGGTIINLGMEMANGIFKENPFTEQDKKDKRNRVVVVFTDGTPGWSGYDEDVADDAIDEGGISKNTYGATVYTVGIFSGANATSAGDPEGTDTEKANWFMQNLSSNNGEVRNPSYYLSAGDADTLNNIFQQIAGQIEDGGSTAELTSETVIKDIIAPAFTLPANTQAEDIRVETYQCTGKNGTAYTWTKNATTMGAEATVNGDQVSVTGFDFKENYVGTVTQGSSVTYRGHKLVISFDVVAKDGFLGGNNVYTNTSAGVYKNSTEKEPVLVFNRPQVNVPVKELSVTPADKYAYQMGSLAGTDLQAGVTVVAGKTQDSNGIPLDMSLKNFGLEEWQYEYVNIGFKDANENVTAGLNGLELKQDTKYTVFVTIDPKSDGEGASGTPAEAFTGSGQGQIYVFKPDATFKDSTIYQGPENKLTDFTANGPVSLEWVREDTDIDAVTVLGSKPKVSYSFDKTASEIQNCTTVQPTIHLKNEITEESFASGEADSFVVHVLKPSVVVNLEDTSAYYGTTYTPGGGKAVVSWSDDVHPKAEHKNIIGTAPFGDSDVKLQYYGSSDATTELGEFTMTKQPAKVYVKAFHGADQLTVTKYITTCDVVGSCNGGHTDTVNGYYTVHPLTCQLTITKKGGAAGEPYVFDIYKDDVKYSEVTIVGNGSETIYELPVGKYTIEEDMGWSWRYSDSYSSAVTLSSTHTSDSITCTNTANSLIYWLNGFSQVVKNIFTKIIQN